MDECGAWDEMSSGVCEMSMCLARGGVGGEWMIGFSLGITNRVRRLYFGCGSVGVEWGLGPGSGGVVLCLCEL